MSAALRRRVACAVLAGSFALTSAATADHAPNGFEDKPQLLVSFPDDRDHSLVLALDVARLEDRPGRVAVAVPPGFDLDAERPPGTTVGSALLFAADLTDTSFGISLLEGEIVAEAPAGPVDPACARGVPLAVWTAQFRLFGEPLELPLVVRAPVADEAGAEQVLELCAPRLPGVSSARLPIVGLYLAVVEVGQPRAAGRFNWRALVEPLAADRRTFANAYEVRAAVPVPHGITLSASYSRSSRIATVRGRLSAAGRPRAGVPVTLVAVRRSERPNGDDFPPRAVGTKRTDANGRFTFRLRTARETVYRAYVDDQVRACAPPTDAPAGCASSTTAGVTSEPVSPPLGRGKQRRP